MTTVKIADCLKVFSFQKEFKDFLSWAEKECGQEILELSGISPNNLDVVKSYKKLYKSKTVADATVDDNSNVSNKSISTYRREVSKPYDLLNSIYMIWKNIKNTSGVEYANECIMDYMTGKLYIHDLHGAASAQYYCFNYSAYDVALFGIPQLLDPKGSSLPPKYLSTFMHQIVQFLNIAGGASLGACGIADLFIVMSIYVQDLLSKCGDEHFELKTIDDCWAYVKKEITHFIYTINQPFRDSGTQSLFTNVSVFDMPNLNNMCKDYSLVINEKQYKASPTMTMKIQELFLDCMNEEMKRRLITFPVTTACFTKDEDGEVVNKYFLSMISEKNSLYGFINIFSGRDGVLSSCCRLRSDTKAKFFSIGGAGVKIGSSGVTTVNLPHVAFENKSKEDIKEELTKLITKAQDINIARRKIIKKAIDNGSHPLYTLGFVSLGKQYSTVGVNGCHEFLEILGYDIKTKEGIDFFGEVVDHMNSVNDQIGLKHKIPTNIEQVPAESAGRKLAVKDTFMGLNVGENVYKLYSNQFIPLTDGSANLLDRIKVQGILDDKFTGGSILHKNIDQIISQDQMMNLIQSSIKLGCVYFAVNFVLNSCSDCMTTSIGSNVKECPNCGSANLVEATRIVGYLTAKNSWSEQRKEEGSKRVFYKPWAA